MKYYIFISETQIEPYDKGYAVVDDVQISNPSADVLLRIGAKPLIVEEEPIRNTDTQSTEHYYEDGETEIFKKWRIVEVVDDELTNA